MSSLLVHADFSGNDLLATVRDKLVKGGKMSPDKVTQAAVASRKNHMHQERISKLGQIACLTGRCVDCRE